MPMSTRLLILSCSQRKRPDSGLLPAIERYNGPPFQVLRKYLRTDPPNTPNMFILSAKFGLIAANEPIPDYDCRMTPSRAEELRANTPQKVSQIVRDIRPSRIFLNLGKDYAKAIDHWNAPQSIWQLTFSDGPPGVRLAQLRQWLYETT
ncbi:MAG: DUF6884 domain-containing protein [Thermomicrobiales bacterium]